MKRIEQMYAFVVLDDDGTEGVPAFQVGGKWLPMVGADEKRMRSLAPMAREMAAETGKPFRLVRFEMRTELEVIEP